MSNGAIFRRTRFLILPFTLIVLAILNRPVATQGRGERPGGAASVNGADAVGGEAILKYRGGATDDDRQNVDRQIDADEDEQVGGTGARRVRSRSFDTATLLNFLRAHGKIAYAEPNYILHATAAPNDPS